MKKSAPALASLLLLCVTLVATPAHARKECRNAPEVVEEAETQAVEDRWPHDVDNGWHHRSGSSDWARQAVAYAPGNSSWIHETDDAWVHETDYGWWAAVGDAALRGFDEDEAANGEEDCTVSRERNECVVLANQLARYTFQLELAREREDFAWEESLLATIERIEARGELYSCPWVEPSLAVKIQVTLEAVLRAVSTAAEVYSMLYRAGLL